MPDTTSGGITIHYEVEGDEAAPVVLLVMGLGAQMTSWDPAFRAALVTRGYRVVHFDNRDVGRSGWLDDAGVPDLAALLGGAPPPAVPYTLADMAGDAVAVLDAVGAPAAHVVGASMGGMIAQVAAIDHPGRVLTLTSIMSTTGAPGVGAPHPRVLPALLAPPPSGRDAAVEAAVRIARVLASPGYPFDEDRARERAAAAVDRAWHPAGTARQLLAIATAPDRTPALRRLSVPTLVIHGDGDVLIDPSGGRATAEAVPGARLWVVPGMGHDLPPALHEPVADAVAELARAG